MMERFFNVFIYFFFAGTSTSCILPIPDHLLLFISIKKGDQSNCLSQAITGQGFSLLLTTFGAGQ